MCRVKSEQKSAAQLNQFIRNANVCIWCVYDNDTNIYNHYNYYPNFICLDFWLAQNRTHPNRVVLMGIFVYQIICWQLSWKPDFFFFYSNRFIIVFLGECLILYVPKTQSQLCEKYAQIVLKLKLQEILGKYDIEVNLYDE